MNYGFTRFLSILAAVPVRNEQNTSSGSNALLCHVMPSASVLACVSLLDFRGEGSVQSRTIGGVISGLALAAML